MINLDELLSTFDSADALTVGDSPLLHITLENSIHTASASFMKNSGACSTGDALVATWPIENGKKTIVIPHTNLKAASIFHNGVISVKDKDGHTLLIELFNLQVVKPIQSKDDCVEISVNRNIHCIASESVSYSVPESMWDNAVANSDNLNDAFNEVRNEEGVTRLTYDIDVTDVTCEHECSVDV